MHRLLFISTVGLVASCGGGDRTVDAAPPALCPADPPAGGATCGTENQRCFWLRCSDEGSVDATCTGGAWMVNAIPCSDHSCAGETCAPDQICHEQAGGALIGTCVSNPCGTAAIEASCACSLCGSNPCSVYGLTVQCNTCPGPEPCP